ERQATRIIKAAANAPDLALPNAYAAALFMMLESPQGPVRARPFLERAQAARGANAREAATAAFVRAWWDGDIPEARRISAAIVAEWPTDLAMLKLNQNLAFNVGDAAAMLKIALDAAPANDHLAWMHGMIAFGYEQCHLLDAAEAEAETALTL